MQMSMRRRASSTSVPPQALKNSLVPPNVAVPKLSAETLRPEPPRMRYSIADFDGTRGAEMQKKAALAELASPAGIFIERGFSPCYTRATSPTDDFPKLRVRPYQLRGSEIWRPYRKQPVLGPLCVCWAAAGSWTNI